MVVCRFFAKGDCARGSACSYEHVADADDGNVEPILCQYYARGYCRNGTRCQFQHKDNASRAPQTPCRYFAAGDCRRGSACRFSHEGGPQRKEEALPNLSVKPRKVGMDANYADDIISCTREIGDAVVTFGAGAAVMNIDTSSSAWPHIKKYGVICSWYKPTRKAFITFSSERYAREAMETLLRCPQNFSHSTHLQCRLKIPNDFYNTYCVEIGNLNSLISTCTLRRLWNGKSKPLDVKLQNCSYISDALNTASEVQELVKSVGSVISWNVNTAVSGPRVKAIAEFANIEEVDRVVDSLNGTIIPLSKTLKLYVNRCISVHFRIFTEMYNAIQPELNRLISRYSTDKHVSFKAFPVVGMKNRVTILRASGEHSRSVARVKVMIEQVLQGTIATKDSKPIWNDVFLQSQGLTYLSETGRPHDVFIYRDARKSRLLLYGAGDARDMVQQKLSTEIDELHAEFSTNIVRLNPPGSLTPMNFERNQASSSRNFSEAGLLQGTSSTVSSLINRDGFENPGGFSSGFVEEYTCVVCLCEATDPYTMRCGHTYCKSCFADQCSSISLGGIPVQCLGEAASCDNVLTLDDLFEALGHEAFNILLNKSLAVHIQANPDKFQYCPTPDCPFIYAVSADEHIVSCPQCSILICTTCRAIDHEGLECEEHQFMRRRNEQAFAAWKSSHNVKDCPKCGSPIEKSEGCNHMNCAACDAHICWCCMEVFEEALLVYAHMEERHGGHYEVDEEVVGGDV